MEHWKSYISIYDIKLPDIKYPAWAENLLSALCEHNIVSYQHSVNVALLMYVYAQENALSKNERVTYYTTGLFHDIGKILIKNSILNQPEHLTPEEKEIIDLHAYYGWKLLNGFEERITNAVLYHHKEYKDFDEHDDLVDALHVIDSYDAIRQVRPYSPSIDRSVVFNYLIKHAGTKFCSDVVQCLVRKMYKYTYKKFDLV